jgi:hypothetical protein
VIFRSRVPPSYRKVAAENEGALRNAFASFEKPIAFFWDPRPVGVKLAVSIFIINNGKHRCSIEKPAGGSKSAQAMVPVLLHPPKYRP